MTFEALIGTDLRLSLLPLSMPAGSEGAAFEFEADDVELAIEGDDDTDPAE